MPGYERTPFGGYPAIFKEQPPIAAHISTDTAQSIPSGAFTTVTFATPINSDPLNLSAWRTVWDPAAPGQFAPTVRGLYLVGASIEMDAMTGLVAVALVQNGVAIATQHINYAAQVPRLSLTTMRPALLGDVFIVQVFQNSGAGLNTGINSHIPNFWIARIG